MKITSTQQKRITSRMKILLVESFHHNFLFFSCQYFSEEMKGEKASKSNKKKKKKNIVATATALGRLH